MTSGPTIDSSASVTAAVQGCIFSLLGTGQEPEVLPTDGEQRPEHRDALVGPLFEHRLEPGRDGEHALARAGVAAEAHDADLGVGQEVDGEALLGRPAPHAEQLALGAQQVQSLVGVHPSQRRLRPGVQRDAGVARQGAGLGEVDDLVLEELVDHIAGDVELDESAPTGVGGELVAVLVGVQPDDGRLEPQREVLATPR